MSEGVSQQEKLHAFKAVIDGPVTSYMDHPVMDNVLDAMVEMSATIWALQDRQIILEKVLADKGIEVSELVEQYLPSEDDIEERRHLREELVNRIFGRFLRVAESDGNTASEAGPNQ